MSESRFSFVHWADEAAARIIHEKGEKELYTCASGITPSGTVHVGNFREIISTELVVRALRDLGKKVRFIYSWDDYDVFRKVPENMPRPEELQKYLRFPITMVPDTTGRDESYARHNEVKVEKALPLVGISPEYLYQAKNYRASVYAGEIRKALEKRETLKAILDKFRDEEHKIQGEWWPVSVFCGSCNRDTTEITGWDGEWTLSYRCQTCGSEESVDLREAAGVKLLWRVDWPMRWAWEHVDFEPAGKDHHSEGGSFDTSRLVCQEVYGCEAPVTFRYDFIGFKGTPGKMSSSRGRGIVALPDLLSVYTPDLVRYLFAGTRPNTEFTISFDLDVIKIYEDYDRTERIAWGLEKPKDEAAFRRERRIYELSQVTPIPPSSPYWLVKFGAAKDVSRERSFAILPPFRHLCNLLQINDGDTERTIARLPALGYHISDERLPALRARCKCAYHWVGECAPEEYRFRLRTPGSKIRLAMGSRERKALELVRDTVVARIETFRDDSDCAQAIYNACAQAGLDGKNIFRYAYQILIGKDQGPRLAGFLRSIDKERLMALLEHF